MAEYQNERDVASITRIINRVWEGRPVGRGRKKSNLLSQGTFSLVNK